MGIYDRPWYREQGVRRAPTLNPVVKWLLIANIAVFVLQWIASASFGVNLVDGLGLRPDDVIRRFWIWELVTSLFLHDGIFHIAFNMFVLWMFGSYVERALGSMRFLRFYFLGGIAASLAYVVFGILNMPFTPAIGASGAIMAVLIYFTMMNPNAIVYLFFAIPMRMKWLTIAIVAIDLFSFLSTPAGAEAGGGVAHTAHLGGALFGFLYYRYSGRMGRLFEARPARRKAKGNGGLFGASDDEERRKRRAEVDRLLEKIHEGGIDSLSAKERDFLREASRREREEGR